MKAVDVFENLASATWQRICLGKAYKISQGEETITDLNLLELARANCPEINIIKTPKTKEPDIGTDWEWWIGNNRLGWLRYAVQAKKIEPKSTRYDALRHEVRGTPQIDILEKYAREKGSIPLYCFYNYLEDNSLGRYWHCNFSYKVNQFGCTVTPSKNVRTALSQYGTKNFRFLHDFDNTKPWRCLVSCPSMLKIYQTGSVIGTSWGFENVIVYPNLPPELVTARETGFLEEFSSDFYSRDIEVYPRQILIANYASEYA